MTHWLDCWAWPAFMVLGGLFGGLVWVVPGLPSQVRIAAGVAALSVVALGVRRRTLVLQCARTHGRATGYAFDPASRTFPGTAGLGLWFQGLAELTIDARYVRVRSRNGGLLRGDVPKEFWVERQGTTSTRSMLFGLSFVGESGRRDCLWFSPFDDGLPATMRELGWP